MLVAIKGFVQWLSIENRISANPFAHLHRLNNEPDIRRKRRTLTDDEFGRLIEATMNGKTINGICGRDRAILYLVASSTGLRASELASLTKKSFDLKSSTPTVTVEACYSKHRREDILPINPGLASQLSSWIDEKYEEQFKKHSGTRSINSFDHSVRLWPGRWAIDRRAGKIIQKDLREAGVHYQDGEGRYFDFHSFRNLFVSNLGKAGVSLTTSQTLARHSDPRLTSNLYTHLGISDLSQAVADLPASTVSLPDQTKAKKLG